MAQQRPPIRWQTAQGREEHPVLLDSPCSQGDGPAPWNRYSTGPGSLSPCALLFTAKPANRPRDPLSVH